MDRVSPPLAPSEGCEQETTSAEMTGRRRGAGRPLRRFPSSRSQSGMRAGDDARQNDEAMAQGRGHGRCFPSSRSQPGMRAGDDDGGTTEVHRGRSNRRSTLGRADPEQGPP